MHRPTFPFMRLPLLVIAAACATAAPCAADPVDTPLPQALEFRDIFVLPVGARGPRPSPTLLQAQGRQVSMQGYMVLQETPVPGEFLLSPRPVQMTEHSDGAADDLPVHTVRVRLAASQHDWVVPHRPGLLRVTGRLGFTRSEREDGRVFWLEMSLPDDAVRTAAPAASTQAPHFAATH